MRTPRDRTARPLTPGRKRRTAAVWLLACAAFTFLGVQAIRAGQHNERWLAIHGTRTDARLTSLSCGNALPSRSISASCSPYGIFTFQTSSGKTATTRIDLNTPSPLKVGDQVPIEYNPHNPANAQTVSGRTSSPATGVGIVLLVFAAFFAIALLANLPGAFRRSGVPD